jgi:hypothetical protein
MRTRILCGLTAALAAGLAAGLGAWLLWPAPFPVRGYERLRLGMAPDEVEAAVGVPPGIYHGWVGSSGPLGECLRQTGIPFQTLTASGGQRNGLQIDAWEWQDYHLWVAYDETGRAVGCYLLEGYLFHRDRSWDRRPLLERIRSCLGF